MRYLKKFRSLNESTYDEIAAICSGYSIHNWTLNKDGSIDVDGDVNICDRSLFKIPLRFRNVTGGFNCIYNELTSLEGSPISVSGDFYCNNNKLTSLKGCPVSVGGSFHCYNNNLKSLKGCPKSIGSYFDCGNNDIVDFEGIGIIDGSFYCDDNHIYQIWCLFRNKDYIELLNDYDVIRGKTIILDRLNDFLRVIGEDPVTDVDGYKCI